MDSTLALIIGMTVLCVSLIGYSSYLRSGEINQCEQKNGVLIEGIGTALNNAICIDKKVILK